jgi:hypothetical protein
MADETKLDLLLGHILELKVAVAELKGARIPERMSNVEEDLKKTNMRWARADAFTAFAGAIGGAFLTHIVGKLGLKP